MGVSKRETFIFIYQGREILCKAKKNFGRPEHCLKEILLWWPQE
jgi:hypothetical protein